MMSTSMPKTAGTTTTLEEIIQSHQVNPQPTNHATRQDNAVKLAVSMTMLCRIRGIIIPGNVYKCIGLSTLQCLAIVYCIVNSLTLS